MNQNKPNLPETRAANRPAEFFAVPPVEIIVPLILKPSRWLKSLSR